MGRRENRLNTKFIGDCNRSKCIVIHTVNIMRRSVYSYIRYGNIILRRRADYGCIIMRFEYVIERGASILKPLTIQFIVVVDFELTSSARALAG